jgi:hypothetical protein
MKKTIVIFGKIAIIFILLLVFSKILFAEDKCKYYITGEDRKTTQFFVAEDWPIVKEWNIDIIWVDTNATIVGIESGGRCGVIEFKTTEFIDKENFRDGKYVGKKIYDCDHFYWTLNHELER